MPMYAHVRPGTRVMIYAGDVDFICNWLGNKAWTLDLEWDGKAQVGREEKR